MDDGRGDGVLIGQWRSTDVPEREQFGFARDLLLTTPVPVRIERPGIARDAGFASASWMYAFGPEIAAVRSIGEAAAGYRGAPEIARGAPDCLWLLQYRDGVGEMVLDDRSYHVEPGDILFGDCGVRQMGDGGAHVDFTMWMVPGAWLRPMLAAGEGDPRGVLRRGTPLGRLASDYLHHLPSALDATDAAAGRQLVANLLSIVAMARGLSPHHDEPAAQAMGDVRLAAIRRDIARRHTDPSLSPATLATRHRLSVRSLHLLFEPTGTSCARLIQETRLATARERLRAEPGQSVADIAFACGFDSLSTFHRAFRARYGHTPAETRDA